MRSKFLLLIFLIISIQSFSQKLINYECGIGTQYPGNPNLWIMQDHVKAFYEDMTFYSDSAVYDKNEGHFTGFGNVKIETNKNMIIYGDLLFYNAATRIVNIKGNVKLIDDGMVLTTKELFYDRNTNIASYLDKGFTQKENSTLKSIKGYYHSNTKDFFYEDSVVLTNDSGIIYSDTLQHNTITNDAFFYGPTQVFSDSVYVYCEYGKYNTDTRKLEVSTNAFLKNESQTLIAKQIFYDRNTEFGIAIRDVIMTDSVNNIILTGHYSEMDRLNHYSFMTDSATLKLIDEKSDTLFLHADSLFAYSDSSQSYKELFAYHHVKFFREDMQGSCDSLYHHVPDSITWMFKNPIIWMDERQFNADTIVFTSGDEGIKTFELINMAFIHSKSDSAEFDQVKGTKVKGYFMNGELDYVDVEGNSESVYYLREDEAEDLQPLIGVNIGKGEKMKIFFEEKKPIKIVTFNQPTMTVYPPQEVPREYQFLSGFDWKYEFRPKSKLDIYTIEQIEVK